jgi:predicted DNA-binding ribbon-helix-helix protein
MIIEEFEKAKMKRTGIYLDTNLYATMNELAEENNCSINKIFVFLIEKGLSELNKKK